jgi:hypothetical protein
MASADIVRAFLAALGRLMGACEASAEFLPGTPCPDGFTCFSAEPRDGVCQHPDVILDEKMKATRLDGDQFSPEREHACIAQTTGAVVRSGAGLHLKLDNTKSRLFKDKVDCEQNPDTCERFSLYDYSRKAGCSWFTIRAMRATRGSWSASGMAASKGLSHPGLFAPKTMVGFGLCDRRTR